VGIPGFGIFVKRGIESITIYRNGIAPAGMNRAGYMQRCALDLRCVDGAGDVKLPQSTGGAFCGMIGNKHPGFIIEVYSWFVLINIYISRGITCIRLISSSRGR
jgi:hypothetical protein